MEPQNSPPQKGSAFRAGFFTAVPVISAAAPMALLFGALAGQKGISALEVMLMSAMVFAGGAQFVAVELWQQPVSWVAMGLTAFLVNLRHLMMGLSLAPKMHAFSAPQRYFALFFLADEIWALSERRAMQQPAGFTPVYFIGLVLPFYFGWVLFTTLGAIFGAAIKDPAAYGLDFIFSAIFIALIAGFWRGSSSAIILFASSLAAIAVKFSAPGAWYIMAGALAGVITAALIAKPEHKAGAE